MSATHHLIVGGQRSGKSRQAEALARQWLAQSPTHEVVVVATAQAWDDEMRARIERHQAERSATMLTVEEPLCMAQTLMAHSAPHRLVLVDCLTLWLTNWLMPAQGVGDVVAWRAERERVLALLPSLASPVVFVSNEVGWGVIPMSSDVRSFVDELGWLNQAVAQRCQTLTLMVAGQPWRQVVQERLA